MSVIVSRDIDLKQLPGVLTDIGQRITIGPGGITFERALKVVSRYLSSQAKLSFDQSMSPDGTPWKPLKRQRNRKRDKKRNKLPSGKAQGGHKPLRDTDLLMGSMVGRGKGSGNFLRKFGPMSLQQGTNRDYGPYHQYGTRHIPARPFAGISDAHADRIAELVADDIMRQLVG